jgi:ABC-2 type transport system permease protein
MRNLLVLYKAELKRTWVIQVRYLGNTLGGIISVAGIFFGLVLGAQFLAGPGAQFGERLESILIGYVIWSLLLSVITSMASGLEDESKTGTLEQVCLSMFGPIKVFLMRAVVMMGWNLIINLVILALLMLLTGVRLSFPVELLLPFVAVLLGAYGLAFVIGAITLLLKRVQQLISLFLFALLFVVVAPFETFEGAAAVVGYLLPMSISAGLLRATMLQAPTVLPYFDLLMIAFINSIAYFCIGLFLLWHAIRRIKALGLLGGH